MCSGRYDQRAFRRVWPAAGKYRMTNEVAANLIPGSGEMADRIRSFDWGSTRVGPIDSWPISLRLAVGTMLECQVPMYIGWGAEMIQFYNDAYRPMLGTTKHPQALGRPAPGTWPELWETIGPMWREVLEGKSFGFNDYKFTIERYGYPEEVFFNFSYSPLRDETGAVRGLLVTFAETTDWVQNERRLQEEKDRLMTLFMQAPAAIAIMRGKEQRFELANTHYHQLVGRSEGQLIGRTVSEAFPELSPKVSAVLKQVLDSGERFVASEWAVSLDWRGDGDVSERYLNLVYEPLRDARGEVEGVMVFAFDVSQQVWARRKAEEAELRSRFALDASGMGEWDLDLLSGVTSRSLRHDQIFGYEQMLPSWSYADFLARVLPAHRERIERQFQAALAEGGSSSFEFPISWPDKSVHWIASRARVERDAEGRALRLAGLVWDITESRAAHEALREASRQKDEFLATLAHELRNPLAPIRNAAHALGQPTLSANNLAWCRDVITRQVSHMALLLDDLLDMSRITTGRIELKIDRVPLETVIHSAVEAASPLIQRKKHTLSIDLPKEAIELDVDPLRLAQVFSNLLTNAAKYTDAGGRIELQARRDAQGLTVSLRDNGIGVEPDALPNLFRMFSQVEAAVDRSEGGLGIGLALSKGLVDLHGGALRAHSEGLGRGTTFELHLPASAVHAVALPEQEPAGSDAIRTKPRRVLVVDDNRDAADSLAVLLGMEGHEVMVAYGGEQALSIGAGKQPDIAILDIGMPGMNGYELARRIRQEPWGEHSFLVAATGWGHEDDQRKAKSAGFDRHLTKPVNPAAVIALLAEQRGP
jgi:PAS domain S-box-containing protein